MSGSEAVRLVVGIASVLAAAGLWWVVFRWQPANFWVLMATSTALLGGLGLWLRPERGWGPVGPAVLLGVTGAVVLYGVFAVGDLLLRWVAPGSGRHVQAVYRTRSQAPTALIAVLLLVCIGPGEELFWRGLIQGTAATLWPVPVAVALSALLYAAVHLLTRNPVLVLAALVTGLAWGGLYAATGSMLAVVVCHALWDTATFVLAPLRRAVD